MAKKPEPKKAPVKAPTKKPTRTAAQAPAKKPVPKKQNLPKKDLKTKPVKKPEPIEEAEYPFTKEGLKQWYDNLEDGVKMAMGDHPRCCLPSPGMIKSLEEPNPAFRLYNIFAPSLAETIHFGRPVRLRILGSIITNEEARNTFMNIARSIPENKSDYHDVHHKTEIYLKDLNAVSASLLGTVVGRSLYRKRSADLIIDTIHTMVPVEPEATPEVTENTQSTPENKTHNGPKATGISEIE